MGHQIFFKIPSIAIGNFWYHFKGSGVNRNFRKNIFLEKTHYFHYIENALCDILSEKCKSLKSYFDNYKSDITLVFGINQLILDKNFLVLKKFAPKSVLRAF